MLRKILATAVLAGLALEANASLTTGDIAFTSFNADEDGWALVNFVDIAANTTIYFSDNTWNGSSFNTTESYHTWNTGASTIAAGTVVRFSAIDLATRLASIGTFSGTGTNFGISASAETIYAYLGTTISNPTTFLTAVSSESNLVSLTNAGLTAGTNAVKLTSSSDFAQYTGDRSSQVNFADYRLLVNNTANWNILVDGADQKTVVPNTSSFTVAAVPVPAAVWLFGSALAGLGVINRRKNQL